MGMRTTEEGQTLVQICTRVWPSLLFQKEGEKYHNGRKQEKQLCLDGKCWMGGKKGDG